METTIIDELSIMKSENKSEVSKKSVYEAHVIRHLTMTLKDILTPALEDREFRALDKYLEYIDTHAVNIQKLHQVTDDAIHIPKSEWEACK